MVEKVVGVGEVLQEEITKLTDHVCTEDGIRNALQLGCMDTVAPMADERTKAPIRG